MHHNTNQFWIIILLIIATLCSNLYVTFTSVKSNQERITTLEMQDAANKFYIHSILGGIEARSTKTAELVVGAITELTTVFRNSQHNDQKSLQLLETIYSHLQERDNAQ
jgi:hypothetical protein